MLPGFPGFGGTVRSPVAERTLSRDVQKSVGRLFGPFGPSIVPHVGRLDRVIGLRGVDVQKTSASLRGYCRGV